MILSINSQGINWWNQGHLKQFYQVIPRECVYRIQKRDGKQNFFVDSIVQKKSLDLRFLDRASNP